MSAETAIETTSQAVVQETTKKARKVRAAKAAKTTEAPKTEKKATKAAKPAEVVASLTGGGARPALFNNQLPKDIMSRYPSVGKLMEQLHNTAGIRTASLFVSFRPDPAKNARVSDWFKLTWTKAGKKDGALPKNFSAPAKMSVAAMVKLDAAFGFLAKLTEPIVYFTIEKGAKKISLNGSFKF